MQWLKFTRKPDSQAKKTDKKYMGPAMRLEDIYTPSLLIPVDDGDNSTELADIDTTPAFDSDVIKDTSLSEPASVDDIDATDSTPPLDVDAVDIPDEELEDIPFITDIETEDTTAETEQSEILNQSEIEPAENVEPVSLDEPAENVEPVSLDEPAENVEPVSLDEPAENVETVSLDEPAENVEIVSQDEPAENVETVSFDEPAENVETVSLDEPAENVEPVSLDEPVDVLEPVHTVSQDEPAENVEPLSQDEPAEEISSTDEIDTTITSETESENVALEIDNSSETTDTNTESDTEEISEPVAEIETPQPAIDFDLGSFTVGETGEIGIDFLFDGGGYKGQIAIISLEGMEKLEWGTSEFFKEAATRALSNSELGYIVISDVSEGARFSAELGEANQNQGAYLGVKTFAMRAGDKFGFMLVPNGTVQQVFDNPDVGGALRPLFSMTTANPNDAYHIGQMADVTGDGNTFVMEDLRVDEWTDKDYNDIVFQVRGATGKAVLMDDVVDANKDWRDTDMGVALIEYAKTYITPELPVDDIEASLEDLMSELEELINNSDNSDADVSSPAPLPEIEKPVSEIAENSADVSSPAPLPEIEKPVSEIAENSADVTSPAPLPEIEKPVSDITENSADVSSPAPLPEIEKPVSDITDIAENSADVSSPAPLPEIEKLVSDITENSADVSSPAPLPEIEKPVSDIADIAENSADTTESESPASQRDLSKIVKNPIFEISEVSENNADFSEPESPTIPAIEKPVSDITEVAENSAEVNSPASPISAEEAATEKTENDVSVGNSEALKREIQDTETSDISEAQPVNSVKTELITRLENLTQSLKTQATEAPAVGGKPVSQSLISQVEKITQNLKNSGNLTTVPGSTIALIERLENLVVKSMPVAIEPIVVPQFEFAKVDQPLVGVIDTGFAANNSDIDYSQVTLGRDYVDGDDNPLLSAGEGSEHGTHILGILKATQGNDIGIDGINDDAPIWVSRAIGSGKWADALVEFVDAAKVSGQPNAVVNLSLDLTQIDADGNVTTRYEFTPQERAAIEYARQHNVLIVAAAGNDGGVMSALGQSSQEFDNIITVGAAERINDAIALSKAYNRADYSSHGYGLDIMAPGGTIDNPELSLTGDSVGTMAGTSVATAKVTGAVSQVWAANPQLSYRQVIEILKDTATDLGEAGFDKATGAGLLNMTAAVSLAKATTPKEYDVLATVIPDTWSGEEIVTPTERAAATEFMGKYYEWDSYTIKSGDSLSAIALRTMGSSSSTYVNFIAQKNGITNVNLIYQNQRILIPRQISAPVQNQPVIPDWQKAIDQAYATSPVNLGPPISGYLDALQSPQGTTGKYRIYQNGTVHWSPKYGAISLWFDVPGGVYAQNGGSGGWLGFPTKQEYNWNGGRRTDFEGGYVYWNGQTAKAYRNGELPRPIWEIAIDQAYAASPVGLGSALSGYLDASPSPQGTTGKYRIYQNGTIHWTPQYGAVPLWLDLQREYSEYSSPNGSNGWLGFPTKREYPWNGGMRTDFEGGYILWNGQTAKAYRSSPPTSAIIDAVNKVNPDQWYYRPRDITGDAIAETFCNWFAADVLDQLGVPIPRNGPSAGAYTKPHPIYGTNTPNKPYGTDQLLGFMNGGGNGMWERVSAADAVASANNGQVVLACSVGHVAVVIPGGSGSNVRIAQAGATNGKDMSVTTGFGNITPTYFRYKGTVKGSVSPNTNTSYSPPATPGQTRQYIVKSGDTLSAIAQRELGNANRWREIKKADGSTFTEAEARNLQVGQSVYLPVSSQTGTSKPVTSQPVSNPTAVQSPVSGGRAYTVRSGDTLWAIAQRELGDGNRWREIKKADGTPFTDAEARRLYVGQLVYLPGGGTTSQPQQTTPTGRSYVVRSGDTLWAIAQRELGNGNRWREIKKADGTPFTDAEARTLYVGQVVYLPGGSQTGGTSGTSGSTQPADFAKALAFVRRWEGGYVNHPSDPGGATNKGITQNTYNAYRASKGLPTKDVRWITDAEVDDIYYTRYWIPSGSNQLTSRLAMVHFDTAVNMGVGGASGLLQQARQSSNGDEMSVVRRYLDLREARYRAIVANNPSMSVFLQGWLNRLNSLRAEVEAMGGGSSTQQSSTGNRYYYVKAGDTPFGIAQRELGNGNRWREIRKEDGTPLTDWDATRLQIGQRLILPENGSTNNNSTNNNSGIGAVGSVTIGARPISDPLDEVLEFIKKIERENSGKSAHEIANKLRGHTKKDYTDGEWTVVTNLSYQPYVGSELDKELKMSGQITDVGHFIASLSDQIMSPWALANLSGDLTSWAGDVGSAIVAYRRGNFSSLEKALNALCKDSDYAADIAACLVGDRINSDGRKGSIADAIRQYNATSYSEQIKTFIRTRLGGIIEGNTLKNPADVDSRIRTGVVPFIMIKGLLSEPNGSQILQGSLHFLSHLVKFGGLESFNFKPHKVAGMPLLGSVNYEISMPR